MTLPPTPTGSDIVSVDDPASAGCAPLTLFLVLACLSAGSGAFTFLWAFRLQPPATAWAIFFFFCFTAFTIFTALAAITLPILLAITRNRQ